MKIKSLLFFLTLLSTAIFLSSCAQPSLTSTWRNNSLPGLKANDVLVLSLVNHPERRKFLENAIVKSLKEENIHAAPSHKVLGPLPEQTREALVALIKKTDAQTVLITYIADIKNKTHYQVSVGSEISVDESSLGAFFESQDTKSTVSDTLVDLQSKMYDVKTEKLIWSGTLQAKNPKITREYMKKIADALVKGLKKDGLL